jgi:thymidylate synthase ThyX
MKVFKVYQSGDESIKIPEKMGTPCAGQLEGTPLEQLTELSGRVCYDSLGKGRNSSDYHKHIIEVNHLSVMEHANLTFEFKSILKTIPLEILKYFINKPGLWISMNQYDSLRVTMNFRTIREWNIWYSCESKGIGEILQHLAWMRAPMIFSDLQTEKNINDYDELFRQYDLKSVNIVSPIFDEEVWISLWMLGSRGWSHEQVRHGDFTAISQRSTRYVDESESAYIWHPLIIEFIHSEAKEDAAPAKSLFFLKTVEETTKQAYDFLVDQLQAFCVAKGMNKFDARKQARGASRGALCNALSTEMIFSANLRQWKWMLKQRMNTAADGEIHEIFKEVDQIINAPVGRVINLNGESKMGFTTEA